MILTAILVTGILLIWAIYHMGREGVPKFDFILDDDINGLDPGHGLDVFETNGFVRWYDHSKGYGFVQSDRGANILLHVTALRASGFNTAHVGARIHCQVLRRPKGLQAFRILSMDESTAIHSSQLPKRVHAAVEPQTDWQRAMVKWYNNTRGFGFLTKGNDTPDIFISKEIIEQSGLNNLSPGEIVQVRWGYGKYGCMAAIIRKD